MCCQVVVKQAEVCRYKQKDKHEEGKKRNGVINEECRNHRGPVKGNSNDPKQEGLGSCQGVSKDLMHGEARGTGDQRESNKQVHDE